MIADEPGYGEMRVSGHPSEMLATDPFRSYFPPLEQILVPLGFVRVPLIQHEKPVQTAVYQFGEISDLARSVGFLVGRGLEEHRGEYAAIVDVKYTVIAMECSVHPAGESSFTESTESLSGWPVSAAIWKEALQKHPKEEFGVLVPEIRFYEATPPRVPTLKSVMDTVPEKRDRLHWVLSYSPRLSDVRPSSIVRDLMRVLTPSLCPYNLGEFSRGVYIGREQSGVVNRMFF